MTHSHPVRILHLIYHYLPAITVLIIGLYLTFATSIYINSVNNFGRSVIFTNDAKQRLELVKDAVIENVSVINQVRNYLSAANTIDRQEFSSFVAPILSKYPGIKRIEWIPHVVDHERAVYEADSSFTEKDAQGMLTHAQARKEYFPIFFVEPFRLEDSLIGYDLGSDAQILKALSIISKTGRNVAVPISPRHPLNSSKSNSTLLSELYVFSPIYLQEENEINHDDPNVPVIGFTRMVLDIDLIIKNTLYPLYPRKIDLIIEDLDTDAKNNMVYYYSSLAKKSIPDVAALYRENKKFLYAGLVHILGRTWQITCVAIDPFYSPLSNFNNGQIWGFGTTITLSLTIYLAALTRSYRKLRFKKESD